MTPRSAKRAQMVALGNGELGVSRNGKKTKPTSASTASSWRYNKYLAARSRAAS
jgi:hypothetical protein